MLFYLQTIFQLNYFILLVFDGHEFRKVFFSKEEMFANQSLYVENTKCPYRWNSVIY